MKIQNILNEISMSPKTNKQTLMSTIGKIGFEIEGTFPFLVTSFDAGNEDDETYEVDEDELNFTNRQQLMEELELEFDWIDDVVEDNSVHAKTGFFGAEIVTKPVPMQTCIEKLTQLLDTLQNKYKMSTNASTGLHINISMKGTDDLDMDALKLLLFIGENHFLTKWGRHDNRYAQAWTDILKKYEMFFSEEDLSNVNQFIKSANRIMRTHSEKSKYSTFNIIKLTNGYIEFRIAGGKDYHLQRELIENSITSFTRALSIACDPSMFKTEYYKKVGKLMSEIRDYSDASTDNTIFNIMTRLGLKTSKKYEDPENVPRHIVEDIFEKLFINKFITLSSVEILMLKRLWRKFKNRPDFDVGRRVDDAYINNLLKSISKQGKNRRMYDKKFPNGEQI